MGLNRSARTTAKRMGSRMGTASGVQTNTTTERGEQACHREIDGRAQRGGNGLGDAGFIVSGVAEYSLALTLSLSGLRRAPWHGARFARSRTLGSIRLT